MMRKPNLPRALSGVESLPEEDVSALIECLESASSRKNLISYLRGLLGAAHQPAHPSARPKIDDSLVEQNDPSENIETIRRAISRILSDKEVFTTNGELIRAIERELGIPMPVGNRRESREKIIKSSLDAFTSLKRPTYVARARKFLEKFGPSQDDYYKALFDILSRRE
jgi:hypothetical protein